MCEDAMVENWEIERKIEDEEIEKRWASIDNEFLDECEKYREWYLNYTKKEEHPMSYRIKKEVEEWERSAPLIIEFETMIYQWARFCFGVTIFTLGIGLIIVSYMLS